MRTIKFLTYSVLFLALCGNAQANEALKGQMTTNLITLKSDGSEASKPVKETAPGDLIEYRVEYKNTGKKPIKNLVVSAPIPGSTEFEMNSNATKVNASFEVSADGGASWGTPPLWKETAEGPVQVDISEYDLVRWISQDEMPAGGKFTMKYRVTVK
ncbi:putative repeat protein (TIGR01451 family) [Litorimonas taeanensis]|uniref:Putative repeat protein (TIGR01451 family) n=1 Tax=Litorimonas taeanensis TaxID=568099 RepID=A0A420WJE7_9PROT|nr:hypothetical protein [Litorimonas taeanensis]RKQ71143.1 putative repeat protein (TIGR01451 family) [Litorimonas taeanensis]